MIVTSLVHIGHAVLKMSAHMPSLLNAVRVLGVAPALRAAGIKRFSQQTLSGFYVTRAIMALFNVGLLDELAQERVVSLPTFARNKNLDPVVLKSLCDYLYAVKVLDRDGDNYSLDRRRPLVEETLQGAFYSFYAYQDIFQNLEALLKQDKKYGVDVDRQSEFVGRGSGAAGRLFAFPMIAAVIRRSRFVRILDLCCGDATFLIDLCERSSDTAGYGLDISPDAISFAQQRLEQKHLQNRIHVYAGDVFHIDTVANQLHDIDVATCVYALHEFLSDDNSRVLELFRRFKSTFPGVPLMICEVIRHTPEELRERPGGVAEIQLWHDLSNQRLLSRNEWKALFRQAGFSTVTEDYVSFARTAIFTVC